jgi:hypothetical protein
LPTNLFIGRGTIYNLRMSFDLEPPLGLCAKIARLVEERGWNHEDFARQANLHRLTVRHIMLGPERRLHNATVGACARALGLSVAELRTEPLPRLLPKMRLPASSPDGARRLMEEAMQPELKAWLERNPDRAAQMTADEIDELLSLQGTGGPLTTFGVAHYVNLLERRRKLLAKVTAVAGTEYIEFLEQFVDMLFEKIQPYRERGTNHEAAVP